MDAARDIENLIYLYASRIDKGELEGVADLLKDAVLSYEGLEHTHKGYEQILQAYQSMTRIYPDTGTPKTRHLTTNVSIELEGGRAKAHSYFTVMQATESFPLQAIVSGQYNDDFVLSEGSWHFVSRHISIDLWGDLSAHLLESIT